MIISCPNCSAHYSVPIAALGEEGRTLRCANCSHSWLQVPYEESVLELDAHEETTAPPPQPAPAPKPKPVPAPEPEPEPEPILDELPDPDPIMEAPSLESSADSLDDILDETLTTDDGLDDIFADDLDDLDPVESGGGSSYRQSDDMDDFSIDDDDEPIPDVFTTPMRKKEKKKKGGWFFKLLFILLLLIGALGAGAHFGKKYVIQFVPEAAPYYDMYEDRLGLKPMLSELMEIRDVDSARRREGNDDILVVFGVVGNISDDMQAVPQVRVSLFDATDAEVQFVVVDPEVAEIPIGGTSRFEALIRNPMQTARRLEVTFVEPQPQPQE